MTEQENITIQSRVSSLETKFEMFMQEMRDFKTEMRQQNEMRANEIRDLQRKHDEEQAKREAAQAKHDADMLEMNQRFYSKFDAMDAKVDANFKEFAKQLHSNFVQTMIGVGAIMAAIGGLLIAALK